MIATPHDAQIYHDGMAIDRSKRLYVVYDVRVMNDGIVFGDDGLRSLWKNKAFWRRADAHASRFGLLLLRAGFQLPGFHSVYLTPTTTRFRMQRTPLTPYDWWQREVAVPMNLAAWTRASRDATGAKADREIVDWLELGLTRVAKRFKRDPTPVTRVATLIRERGADALVPLKEKKTRHGTATAMLRIAPLVKGSELIVRAALATEPGTVREARLKLLNEDDAFALCRGVKFDGKQIELTRNKSFTTRILTSRYPRKLRFAVKKMKLVKSETV